jgi:hypothetical protein
MAKKPWSRMTVQEKLDWLREESNSRQRATKSLFDIVDLNFHGTQERFKQLADMISDLRHATSKK